MQQEVVRAVVGTLAADRRTPEQGVLVGGRTNNFSNSLLFFAAGGVAGPGVGPAMRRARALMGTKSPARPGGIDLAVTGH
jgi:hypothetical protein